MDLEGIMFSEVSQTKTNTVLLHWYVEPKKNRINKYDKTNTEKNFKKILKIKKKF